MIDDKDIPDDVKGDLVPEIDPKKLFDEKEYATIILGSDTAGKKDLENADCAVILVSHSTSREEKDEALKQLKENDARTFLKNAIDRTKKPEQKAPLIAACWETGLDFSSDYLYFAELITHSDFYVSFEAFTVIQELETSREILEQTLNILESAKKPHENTLAAIEYVRSQLNALS